MRDLTEIEVARAVTLIENGLKIRQVARNFHRSPSVIKRIYDRYRETGQYKRRTGQGRKRKTSQLQDRYLVLSSLRKRTATAKDLQSTLRAAHRVTIYNQTVRNRLRVADLKPRRPVRKPVCARRHKTLRLNFARDHLGWQLRHWRPVLFTDESRFRLTRCDGRVRVYRRPNERYSTTTVQEVSRFGDGSVMVWGGISLEEKTDLVVIPGSLTAERYIDIILADHVIPAAYGIGPDFLFMQDNARPHTAAITTDFLNQHEIHTMDWPAISPDLNPIEHLWDILDRRIRRRLNPPQTLQQLTEALVEEWNSIPQEVIRRLVRSMPRRCQEVIRATGGHTRY